MTTHLSDSVFDLSLTSGRVRVSRHGSAQAPLVILVHGLSAHMHSFDTIIEKLADQNLQLVAVDLRGRGRSEITPAGTYGLDAHSRDVLEIASLLGAEQFDLIGWSMGALIGIGIANLAPQRLRRLVLIDHAGKMDAGPVEKIRKGLERLDVIVDRPSTYLDAMRLAGSISPWSSFWDNYYRYELGPYQQGFKPTTSKMACTEDLNELMRVDFSVLWKNLTMPALLIRCLIPIADGYIVPASERDQLQLAVPSITIAEFDCDHYSIMNSLQAIDSIRAFFN